MALFRSLRSLFSPVQARVYYADMGVRVADMDAAALYRTQPNLRAVVSFLADNAAQVPIKVHDRRSDTDRPRVLDSPAALLLQQPNQDMTPYEFKRWMYTDLLLYERFLVLVLRSADTRSGWELRPIPNRWISAYHGSSPFSPESIDVMSPGNAPVEIPADRFILFHGYDPADPMGQSSRMSALREILHEQVESNAFRRKMWQRGGRFNAYLTRPADVEEWTDSAKERFIQGWRASWAGSDASDAGGMPILEDGMEIKTVQFNSRDAQWAESVKLSREDAAAVYHVNPAMIWPGSGQTYASAKDNARALYNDCLSPTLMFATDRINMKLLPMVGEPEGHYAAYDISIKTEGTFEEKLSALSSAVGAPFMSRNEARAKLDLAAVDGCDEMVVPLNVLIGGQASPHDADPTAERYSSLAPRIDAARGALGLKSAEGREAPADGGSPEAARKSGGDPQEGFADELAVVYRSFFERQEKSVVPKIEAGDANWWNAERWNRELADDLYPVAIRQADAKGERAVAELWPGDPSRKYGKEQTAKYVRRMCEMRAEVVNAATRNELERAIGADGGKGGGVREKGLKSTVRGVFQFASQHRALAAGAAFAAGLAGFAVHEACRQNKRPGESVFKTWRTNSGNPRSSHRALNGETVQMDSPFSNGMRWPGDWTNGSAAECANCKCVIDAEVRENGRLDDRESRIARRIAGAEVIGEGLYDMTPAEVVAEAEEMQAELDRIVAGNPNLWDSRKAYKAYADYVASKATRAPIAIEDFTRIEGKELQLSSWFSAAGIEVSFRNPNVHLLLDGNTSDAEIFGMTYEFKRTTSGNVSKLVKNITGKLDRQGPGFVADLSASSIMYDDAMQRCAALLEDDAISEIVIVKNGKMVRIKS